MTVQTPGMVAGMMPPIEAREKRCFRPIGLTGFSQSRTVFGDQRCKCAPRWPLISIHHISPFASRFSQHRRRLVPHKLKKQRKRKAYTDRKPLTHNFNRSNWNSAVQKHGAFFWFLKEKTHPTRRNGQHTYRAAEAFGIKT